MLAGGRRRRGQNDRVFVLHVAADVLRRPEPARDEIETERRAEQDSDFRLEDARAERSGAADAANERPGWSESASALVVRSVTGHEVDGVLGERDDLPVHV